MKTQTKKCTICGTEYTPASNRQKYCKECRREANLAVKAAGSRRRRAAQAASDKAPVGLSAHVPENVADDWSAESRKIKNEIKRTFRTGRNTPVNNSVNAREIALSELTIDQRDNDWKGSIEDFFNMKDDK
jgi:regulator of extracellular matrix RemA (YlzA/DUF370 family)